MSGTKSATPSIDVVIVSWNAGSQIARCVASIAGAARDTLDLQRLLIVDNGSTDHSLDALAAIDLPLTIIRNAENRGFAAACNQGAKGTGADYLLFLNPDTRLLSDALARPVAFMEGPEHQRVGIVGIQLLDTDGSVALTCARHPTPGRFFSTMVGLDRVLPRLFPPHFMVEWDHRENRDVDQVMGAFFLIRRSVFESLGGFDERFFVYYEEVDLSVRARALGWSTFYLSGVQAYHYGSAGTAKAAPAMRLFFSLRSRILYAYKHFNRWTASLVTFGTLVLEPLSRLVVAIARRSPSQMADTVKAYALLWRAVSRGLVAPRTPAAP